MPLRVAASVFELVWHARHCALDAKKHQNEHKRPLCVDVHPRTRPIHKRGHTKRRTSTRIDFCDRRGREQRYIYQIEYVHVSNFKRNVTRARITST